MIKLAFALNGVLIAANVALYWANFRYARRTNRRFAALARQVKAEMEGVVTPIRHGVRG